MILKDFVLKKIEREAAYTLLKLTPADDSALPDIKAGQFVNVQVLSSHDTFLRRPISVNYIDRRDNILWLLVNDAGPATHALCNAQIGEKFSILLPLGNGFSAPKDVDAKILLCGGGVGIAPMLQWGNELKEKGYKPIFLLSGRNEGYLPQLDMFRRIGEVHLCTDDGSVGMQGFPTQHPALTDHALDMVYCCGPLPMMKGVANVCKERGVKCYVSLENKMACGLGACLCCVEDTVHGNTCVCKAGPVFDTHILKW